MIQAGEYVRTTHKGIKKIARIDEKKTVRKYMIETGHDHSWTEYEYLKTYDIAMHSFNLIDLIKKGDYVNGSKVVDVGGAWKDNLETITIIETETAGEITDSKEIESVVTKEQFAEAEYKEEQNE